MWQFIKTLALTIYRNTVGGVVRLVENTRAAKLDDEDKRFVARVLIYTTFGVVSWFFPAVAMMLLALRIMFYSDVFNIFATGIIDGLNNAATAYR